MANTSKKSKEANVEEEVKATKTTKTKAVKKDEVMQADLQAQLDKEKSEKEAMEKRLKEMETMMLQLQQTMLMQSQQNVNIPAGINDNDPVEIISYGWGKLSLADKDGAIVVSFRDAYEVEKISYRQLMEIATTKNKNNFFKKGLIALVGDSKKYYNNIGVTEPYILSKENLISLYKGTYQDAVKKIESLIDKKEDRVWTTIYYQTLRMLAKNEISDANILTTINLTLTQYFGVRSIQTAIGMVNLAKDLNIVR